MTAKPAWYTRFYRYMTESPAQQIDRMQETMREMVEHPEPQAAGAAQAPHKKPYRHHDRHTPPQPKQPAIQLVSTEQDMNEIRKRLKQDAQRNHDLRVRLLAEQIVVNRMSSLEYGQMSIASLCEAAIPEAEQIIDRLRISQENYNRLKAGETPRDQS